MSTSNYPIKKALISVSDKTKLVEIAKILKKFNVEILSSGGSAKFLDKHGIKATKVSEVTGNPEAFGGRMKTLSFQIGSGLLFRRDHAEDIKDAKELEISAIDLVICNLYPFKEVVAKNGSYEELIENIDIGGPTMIRAAAKNHAHVAVLTNSGQYESFIEEYSKNQGATSLNFRKKWALDAFRMSASYDALIANELENRLEEPMKTICLGADSAKELRYGENPHQKGMLYRDHTGKGLAFAKFLQGKALSYNNLLDSDAAYRSCSDLAWPNKSAYVVTIIKHSNPCGAAISNSSLDALTNAWASDPVSSFGGILCFNQEVKEDVANWLSDKFIEVVIAPSFSQEALSAFAKKKNLRVLELEPREKIKNEMMIRSISGGLISQHEDEASPEDLIWKSVTKKEFTEDKSVLVNFGIFVAKHLRSNAIALVAMGENGPILLGAGMGNPNRKVSVEQAISKAHENGFKDLSNAILISDAFFPFADNIVLAHDSGVKSIVQPGGSIKDPEIIKTCDELGIAMCFTGRRHFRH